MKQKRHKPEEVIRLLRECDGSGLSQESFCREKQISVATLQRWGIDDPTHDPRTHAAYTLAVRSARIFRATASR